MQGYKILIITIVTSSILASGTTALFFTLKHKEVRDTHTLIHDLYAEKNATFVDPHTLRQALDKGTNTFILVDIRSKEEYTHEHIVSAISIPTYTDPTIPSQNETEKTLSSFSTLALKNPGKDIVVYCSSAFCMAGQQLGQMLAGHNIFIKQLGIGWNEWRYFWTLWNHEDEWSSTHAEDYVIAGTEPGKLQSHEIPSH